MLFRSSADAILNILYTSGQPDPELLIRTLGEQKLGDSYSGSELPLSTNINCPGT